VHNERDKPPTKKDNFNPILAAIAGPKILPIIRKRYIIESK
jgi:hypothetical protein